jgi:putative ABC transport system permease protein
VKILSIIFRNAFRHKLRTSLTILGIATAVMAFGLLRTIVGAWSAGVAGSSANRMIVRHRVSFILPLPTSDRAEIERVPGVTTVSWANWFGGVYGPDPNDFKNFWPRMAVDPETWFKVYPEFIVAPDQLDAFMKDRSGCVIGQKLATQHGFKIGDVITMNGDIFPGSWQFTVRGIYHGKEPSTDETQMFFQWNYLYEQVNAREPGRTVGAGWYVLQVKNPDDMPKIAGAVDDQYTNSAAPTKTESERAFQQGFVAMSSAIITSLQVISFVIIGIILLVLANTIVMAVRERTREYAVLKTIGFTGRHLVTFILGESLVIGLAGGLVGVLLTFPVVRLFSRAVPTMFPVIGVSAVTIVMALIAAGLCGVIAATPPTIRAVRLSIVNGLRTVG